MKGYFERECRRCSCCLAVRLQQTLSMQEAIDGAAKEGHIDAVVWLSSNTNAGATKAAMVR